MTKFIFHGYLNILIIYDKQNLIDIKFHNKKQISKKVIRLTVIMLQTDVCNIYLFIFYYYYLKMIIVFLRYSLCINIYILLFE